MLTNNFEEIFYQGKVFTGTTFNLEIKQFRNVNDIAVRKIPGELAYPGYNQDRV